MGQLNELIDIVTSLYDHDDEIVQKILGGKRRQKLLKLADAFRNQEEEDESAVIKRLYGNKKNTATYRKLKSRLRSRLIDGIFLSNSQKNFKFPYDKSLFIAERNLLAAHLLLLKGHRNAAIELTKSALKASMQFQHTYLSILACRILCYHSAFTASKKNLTRYSEILKKVLSLFKAETQMMQLNNNILVRISKNADYTQEQKKYIETCYKKASLIHQHSQSYGINLSYFRIAIRNFHSKHQFEKVIDISKNCTAYLKTNPHLYQRVRLGEFALYEMEACLRLQHYERGNNCAARCLHHLVPYTSPWLVFNEQYFLLAMRTENYLKALDIFYSVTSSYRFKKLSPIKIELWKIYEAWLNFALPDSLPKKQFNLFRFLNEVPILGSDKAGYNFSILIAQILLLINILEKEKLFEIETAFRLYLNRYIKRLKYPRHFIFGSMIRILFNCDFNPVVAKEKAKIHFKNLEITRLHHQPLEEAEIIPYPILWTLILEKIRLMK